MPKAIFVYATIALFLKISRMDARHTQMYKNTKYTYWYVCKSETFCAKIFIWKSIFICFDLRTNYFIQ